MYQLIYHQNRFACSGIPGKHIYGTHQVSCSDRNSNSQKTFVSLLMLQFIIYVADCDPGKCQKNKQKYKCHTCPDSFLMKCVIMVEYQILGCLGNICMSPNIPHPHLKAI